MNHKALKSITYDSFLFLYRFVQIKGIMRDSAQIMNRNKKKVTVPLESWSLRKNLRPKRIKDAPKKVVPAPKNAYAASMREI